MLNRKTLFMKAGFVAGAALTSQAAYADHHEEAAEAAVEQMEAETEAAEAAVEAATIVETASASADHTMLVEALQLAGLAETLSGDGPFTVFAPTDDAFGLVPEETLDALMQEAAREQLRLLLAYHVVPGSYDAETLVSRIEAAGGELTLQTVANQPITVELINDAIVIGDASGGQAYVTTEDLEQSNGMIHVVNGIIVPDFTAQSAAPAEGATEGSDAE